MYTMVVEQTNDYHKRMRYDPISDTFIETQWGNLFHACDVNCVYGWIRDSGAPPHKHLDVILCSTAHYDLGDEVAVKIVGCFIRNDGDHKLVSVLPDRTESNLSELPDDEKDNLFKLYPRVDEGEGWYDRRRAYEIINPWFDTLYTRTFEDICAHLAHCDCEATTIGYIPFRKRSEHIWRVFNWAKRLTDDAGTGINKHAILIAALFHDVGYAISQDSKHALYSAQLFRDYAQEHGFYGKTRDLIEYLIVNHSNKELMDKDDTPPELIALMEADLLDDTGALSIVWDCMIEGAQTEQSFVKTYNHILAYSAKTLDCNIMKSTTARAFWAEKQDLLREFIRQYSFDLAISQ